MLFRCQICHHFHIVIALKEKKTCQIRRTDTLHNGNILYFSLTFGISFETKLRNKQNPGKSIAAPKKGNFESKIVILENILPF